jgi:hypothetical protein
MAAADATFLSSNREELLLERGAATAHLDVPAVGKGVDVLVGERVDFFLLLA